MRRLLLDTNVYSAFKRGEPTAVELLAHADEIVVNAVVLGELVAGFVVGSQERRNREELTMFLASPRVRAVAVDDVTAGFYARLFALLRSKGRPIPTNDLWIAASALQHGLVLATFDGHFAAIEGLATVDAAVGLLP
jgi:tRNA(fMet)-specific endonuclease VapC